MTCSSTGRDYVEGGGERRYLMAKLPVPGTKFALPTWRAAGKPMIPREAWKPVDWSGWLGKVLDQDGKNACTGYSWAGALRAAFAAAGARVNGSPPDFSPTYNYALNNGGVDQGAMCADLVKQGKEGGTCLEAEFPESKLFARQIPAAARTSAANWKLGEAYQVTSFDEYGSALQCGFFAYHGFQTGQRFEPGADGLLPDFAGSGGGHALFSFGMKPFVNGANTKWTGAIRNSWAERWGLRGNCYCPESYFWYERQSWRGTMRNLDCWVFKAVVESPADTNLPPDLRVAA